MKTLPCPVCGEQVHTRLDHSPMGYDDDWLGAHLIDSHGWSPSMCHVLWGRFSIASMADITRHWQTESFVENVRDMTAVNLLKGG
jgi:hypothetical protein